MRLSVLKYFPIKYHLVILNSYVYIVLIACNIIIISGVCKIYEEHLKRTYPNSPSITYDISQLFDFIDGLTDLSCLV